MLQAVVNFREQELVGRPGKQPDGSARTREVKLCTVWSAEGRDEDGTPVRDEGSISYSAAIESAAQKDTDEVPSEFAARVERETTRRAFDRAARRAVLGDGATWIWNLATEHYPDAVQIVDRFHAKQHLSDVSKSVYGAGSDRGAQWARARHDELDAGDIDAVLTAVRVHAPKDEEARTCVGYVEDNRARMRYAEFRAAGLCTSTGVVEAGCKVAIGTRLKRAGMHWTVAGADAIIPLLQAQRTLRGLLGAPRSAPAGRMTARHLTIVTCARVRLRIRQHVVPDVPRPGIEPPDAVRDTAVGVPDVAVPIQVRLLSPA
ncbi:MAG: hypothetical protein HY657_03335 [Acidobacteria bacterium]|nr:hypothetical protein [Acidobacteriota bacterium]